MKALYPFSKRSLIFFPKFNFQNVLHQTPTFVSHNTWYLSPLITYPTFVQTKHISGHVSYKYYMEMLLFLK